MKDIIQAILQGHQTGSIARNCRQVLWETAILNVYGKLQRKHPWSRVSFLENFLKTFRVVFCSAPGLCEWLCFCLIFSFFSCWWVNKINSLPIHTSHKTETQNISGSASFSVFKIYWLPDKVKGNKWNLVSTFKINRNILKNPFGLTYYIHSSV